MDSWLPHALAAVVALGGMQALNKVPSAKGHSKFAYSFLSFLVGSILALVFFWDSVGFDSKTLTLGLLWGAGYAALTLLQMEILKRLDTSATFPITSLSSHVLVVAIGVSFFNDALSALQVVGIALTFVVVGFYNGANRHITLANGLFPTALGIVLFSTFCKFVQKFGSSSVETGNFIFWQLLFAAGSSYLLLRFAQKRRGEDRLKFSGSLVGWSALLGALQFIGTVEIVRALSTGPFSLVYTVNSFYILVASLVAWKFFGEKLTGRKVAFILLAILTIVLIKLG